MNLRRLILCFTCVFLGVFFLFGCVILGKDIPLGRTSTKNKVESNASSTTYEPVLDDELKEPFNVLILGGDKVNKNTDTIMVANVDCKKPKITVLSIPRDTRVLVKGKLNKINSAYPLGKEKLAMKTVGDFLNIDIKYYVYMDVKAFREIVDLFDGVDYDVPVDMDYDDPYQKLHIHLKKGPQHLDGDKAEQFMRFRHYNKVKVNKYYDGSDIKRIAAQQSFIKEFIKQKLNIKYLTKASSFVDTVYANIDTNINANIVVRSMMYFNKFDVNAIDMITLPGRAAYINKISYYLYDRKQTYEIVKGSFVTNNKNISLADFLNYDTYTPRKSKKNYSENNPSNSQSNIKSSGVEKPI